MGEIPTRRKATGVNASRDPAFAAVEHVRTGDFRSARSIVGAALARDATDPYLAGAALHVGRVLDERPLLEAVDAAALWHAVVRGGSHDAIAFFGGAYAAAIGESLAAREILETALSSGASFDASIETILAAAELGERTLRARVLVKIEPIANDAAAALRGMFEHASALTAFAAGDAERARIHGARARLAYLRAGWTYYAARADELCGDKRSAQRTYRRLGATNELKRLAATAPSAAPGEALLSPREREVADLVAAGLANKAIAQRLFISPKTVEKNITALYGKLGVATRVQLARRILGNAPPGKAPAANLPEPITPFVGRTEELADLHDRLTRNRLLSLVGPGGSGKSRLATELARRVEAQYSGGAWFVDLAPLRAGDNVMPALAATLGIARDPSRPTEAAVSAWLAGRTVMLVLDNCEHLLPNVAAAIRGLLESAPKLHVITTTRQRIGIFGENVFRVGAMHPSDASAFFHDRARAAGSPPAGADLVRRICDRLDGIPLAIELAAAHLFELTPEQLAAAIEARVPVLRTADTGIGARHRSIDALIDWGYEPLPASEQRIFRHVAVFAGTFRVETAVRLFGRDAVPAIESLRRRSLIERLPSGGYRMLQIVRDVALAKLCALDEERDALAGFATYYDELLAAAAAEWYIKPIATWLEPLQADRHNILAAVDWCLLQGHAVDAGIRMTANAARIWSEMAREPELEPYLNEALRCADQGEVGARTQLWLARARNFDVVRAGPEAVTAAHRALESARESGDPVAIGMSNLAVGSAAASMRDIPTARTHLEAALATFGDLGLKRPAASAHTALAIIAEDDPEKSAASFRAVLDAARSLDDALLEAITLSNLSIPLAALGKVEEAAACARQATGIFERLGAPLRLARSHIVLARAELACGNLAASVDAAGLALRYFADIDAPLLRADAAEYIAKALADRAPSLADTLRGYVEALRAGDVATTDAATLLAEVATVSG